MIAICLLAALKQVEGTVRMGELLAGCHLRVTPDLLISNSGLQSTGSLIITCIPESMCRDKQRDASKAGGWIM